jgi:hypothetical protein
MGIQKHWRYLLDAYLTELNRLGMCLMVWKDGEVVFSSPSKGIRPHLEAIEKLGRGGLVSSVMADKIVGRAAALLMLYSVPVEVHAGVITTKAKELLIARGVKVYHKMEVPVIKERDGRIYCPFEAMVQDINDPEEAYTAIVMKMRDMN